jgi:outer membrane protein OmpA-like peptidoglycan-associated protein
MVATEFKSLAEQDEELEEEAFPFGRGHELQSYAFPESVVETEWTEAASCPRPTRAVVFGFPRYSVAIESLPPREQDKVKSIARLIARSSRPGCRPVRHVQIVGHADRDLQRGSAFEKKVSLQRALAAQRALQGLLSGYAVSLPIVWNRVGVGAARPAVPAAATEQQRALNRRVEILVGARRPPVPSIEELGRITGLIGLKLSNAGLWQLQSGQTVSLAGRSPDEIRSAAARAKSHFSSAPSGVSYSESFPLPSWIRDCGRTGCKGACVVVKRGTDRFGRRWVGCLCIGFFWVSYCSNWLPPPFD